MTVGPVLTLEGVRKVYRSGCHPGDRLRDAFRLGFAASRRELVALDGIDFQLFPGDVVGVIGANGAGKSTLLKIIARLIRPTAGRVELQGRVTPLLSLDAGFRDELSGLENLRLYGRAVAWPEAELEAVAGEVFAFAGIDECFRDLPFRTWSSGMRARLLFAATTRLDPDILLVDEVLAVGDASFQERCMQRLRELTARSKSVMIISHALTQLEKICNRLLLLDRGRVLQCGPFADVVAFLETLAREDEEIRSGYDRFRDPAGLSRDDLPRVMERARAFIPASALPPFRFLPPPPAELHLEFPLAALPFSRLGLRRTNAVWRVEAHPFDLPPALRTLLPCPAPQPATERPLPLLVSWLPDTGEPFRYFRPLLRFPLPGDRLELGAGQVRTTEPQHRLGLEFAFPRRRPWQISFDLYLWFARPEDLRRARSLEFMLDSGGIPLTVTLLLRDEQGGVVYAQVRLGAAEGERPIVFSLPESLAGDAGPELLTRVRGISLRFHPRDSAGQLDLSLPRFRRLVPAEELIDRLQWRENLDCQGLENLALTLIPRRVPPPDLESAWRLGLGHYAAGQPERSLADLLPLLGHVENAELHAFLSRARQALGQRAAALDAALDSLFLAAQGRGQFASDRREFALSELAADWPAAAAALASGTEAVA